MFGKVLNLLKSGDKESAILECREIVRSGMDNPDVLKLCADIAVQCGAYGNAVRWLQQAIKTEPDQAISYCCLGIAYVKQNMIQKAKGCFSKALVIDPNCVMAYCEMGMLFFQNGQLVASRDSFCKAVSIDGNDWRALGNLCLVLRDLGDLQEAMRVGRRAVALRPDAFQIWHNLGNVCKDMGFFQEAIKYYQTAVKIRSDNAGTYVGMGISYYCLGKIEEAVHSFKIALSCDPSEGTATCNLFNIAMMNCDWKKVDYYKKLVDRATIKSLREEKVPAETPFLNLIRSDDPALNCAVARAWSRDIDGKLAELRKSLGFKYKKNRQGRIRIGYISNNFGDHPTAHITRRLYGLHDRERFEIFCYSYGAEDNSCYRKDIKEGCNVFVDIRNISNAEAARRINDDGVDILVDLVGYMKGGRIEIAALRPAPVQVRWLGMAGTTGADFFDYLITDRIVTPENQSHFYSEKYFYLPECYQINDNRPFIEEDEICRSDFGLPEDAFVYSCFNTSYKIDADVFAVWMNILRRCQETVLWMMAHSATMKKNLRMAAKRQAVDPNRLIFAEKIPKNKHLARLSLADLVLDTISVNGAASTSDALWSGVPVLTVQGNHYASRMASSILMAAGLSDLIARNLIEYEEKAVALAQDHIKFGPVKQAMECSLQESPLFHTEQFVCNLEKGYELIWNRHLNGKAPRLIEV
ncbi:tetratricopeptide repeat protein [uncultured Desulfosarcina sp.]|uniref:O-linked N-acetylglucosamine transferase, SPINDLY family protein n=1 Tax=uncultured Desulfosarcina sp. TaxID=218289 RepID=UPI0029C8367D|nr:tetratricopeptide repeat protein [uncultured Desulfosarcina sp.]